MDHLVVGFKAFDIHELLLHQVATRAGYYEKKEIKVELKDVAFSPDDSLRSPEYLVACGSALTARLEGIPWRIVFVTTDNPMFWLYSRDEMTDVNDLTGRKIAGHPLNSPPGRFLRIIMRRLGLNRDSEFRVEYAHDDFTRLGLLRSGQVDAAVISSAIPPPRVQRMGFKMVCAFGDYLRVPTTGLAVLESVINEKPEQVREMVRVFQSALTDVFRSPKQAIGAVADLIDDSMETAKETYDLILPLLSKDGKSTESITENALQLLSEDLSIVNRPPQEEVYDFSFQESTD